eukprot:m.21179 g.21179  ORF g.21179 m.21179 type:complete len:110 (-) comp7065_c0_seq1:1173-1502(-)
MSDPRIRQLKLKTGVLKRYGKDREYNMKEKAAQEKRIEKFKEEGRDEYDIKKQHEVLEECLMMIPETQKKLAEAHKELAGLLETEKDLIDSEEYKAAAKMLSDVPVEPC